MKDLSNIAQAFTRWIDAVAATVAATSRPLVCALVAALLGLAADCGALAQELSAVRQFRADISTPLHGLTSVASDESRGGAPASANAMDSSAPSGTSTEQANPLWAVPLASLTPTRERPIFSPSRRPPAAAPAPAPVPPPPPMASAEEKPRKPPFLLLAAIASGNDEIALLLEETTKIVVRLRPGESRSGWTLRSVRGREAILEGHQQTATLALPNPLASLARANP